MTGKARYYGVPFLVGFVPWGAVALFIYVVNPSESQQLLSALCGALLCALIAVAASGWSWFSGYGFGTYGSFIKYGAIFLIALTVVGLLPIIYWTGLTVLKFIGKYEYSY